MLARRTIIRAQSPRYSRSFHLTPLHDHIKLAHDLHEPPKDSPVKNAPIVFIHGLFGSKKNNRSMSK